MNLDRVSAGVDVPNDCNVIIEIPMHAVPIKYEIDKQTGRDVRRPVPRDRDALPVQLRLRPAARFPGDGDPVDVLVVSPLPIVPGAVVRCRPIGMLKMEDEAGDDTKVLAVPIDRLSPLYRSVQSARDLPEITLAQIAHFFEHYKDLERGKWVKVWAGPAGGREAGDPRRHRRLQEGEEEAGVLSGELQRTGGPMRRRRDSESGARRCVARVGGARADACRSRCR